MLLNKLKSNGQRLFSSHALASKFKNINEVKKIWKAIDVVCFDVDSTVVTGEGIDILADHCGKGKEVAEWTKHAMSGEVPFHVALEERLNLFTPSKKQIKRCNKSGKLSLTKGISELITKLQSKNKKVFFVSGGFRQMINPHALELGIPLNNIYANNILFDEEGTYAGFDEQEPTSKAGGKAKVVGLLKEKLKLGTVAMIGDGYTDLEARPPADIFIGFGGIVIRESVKENADWFITDFQDLIKALD